MNIKPAILPHSFEEIQEKLSRLEGISARIQIDLCDGVFGREKTWMPDGTESMPSGFSYEFDLMLNDWGVATMNCIKLGAKSIVVHMDSFTDEDIKTLVGFVGPHGVAIGIAVLNDKSVDFHAEMIRKTQALYQNIFIQVVGIKTIGEQGLPFDEEATERVKLLKQQFGGIELQVDGSMKPETGKLVKSAGASTLVVGTYIFGSSDAMHAYQEMSDLE